MKVLFIANLISDKFQGIFKKTRAESRALGALFGYADYICKDEFANAVIIGDDGSEKNTCVNFLDYAIQQLQNGSYDMVYVRWMIPSFKLLKLFSIARKRNIKSYYEIPTYPYFYEQFMVARKKYRAVAKIMLDAFFLPLIYNKTTNFVVIKSNSRKRIYKKMIEMHNGLDFSNISQKTYRNANRIGDENKKTLKMVAVGTFYEYHGYDRLLKGLKNCDEKVGDVTIETHFVGKSQVTDELKQLSSKLELSHVFFDGEKTAEELNSLYDDYDIGLGCLALHRRKADIDTTLKVVEYYCRGVPVVSSGFTFKQLENVTCFIKNDNSDIDIKQIVDFYYSLEEDEKSKIAPKARAFLSWRQTFSDLFEGRKRN